MRESGILMHITSLPGPYGIGSMGKEAYAFADFLEAAGQSCWQILPLNPTGYGDSPYQAFSTFSGNPYLIDLDVLAEEGLLRRKEIRSITWHQTLDRVDFGTMYRQRNRILRLAYERFVPDEEYEQFLEQNRQWLPDYALFMALKEQQGTSWLDWPEALKNHDPEALAQQSRELEDTLDFHYFLQFSFYRQWSALRRYVNSKGIRIIGDVPIYVPLDSADVWANPELFQLDGSRHPEVVAGCPPDAFTEDGQLWGNPIYRWDRMKGEDFRWWIRRLSAAAKMYDMVRFDHFRGFESYWAVPAGDTTARNGRWVQGPGKAFIDAVKAALPDLDIIAEDLGYVTPEVRQLQEESGYPGMKVLEFAFDSREESDYLPHLYPVNSVCYTGTHDNVTLKQWLDEASAEDVAFAKRYLGLNRQEGYTWGIIRGAMGSVSRLCVVQMQDYLGLGKEGRMNFPGTLSMDNWTWRARKGFASNALAEKIYTITKIYGRTK